MSVAAEPMIVVGNLDVTFAGGRSRTAAVQGVSFDVTRGGSFGIVGESGSGKSTVLKAVAGLIDVRPGSIRINGQVKGAKRTKADRKLLQYVFQDPYGSLHPRQTVDRTLREPLAIHGLGGADERIVAALADVGLDSRHRYSYPHQLSGGQRQRVAIARALILSPSILLLDEPTSALDVSVQAEILNLLAELRKARSLTTIFVSHDLAVIAHFCERAAIMREGRIVETVSAQTLRDGDAGQPYSRSLIAASRGYQRARAASP